MKKKLSHSILSFPTSFEHRLVFEGGIFKNKKLQKLREFISFILRQMFDIVTTTILTSLWMAAFFNNDLVKMYFLLILYSDCFMKLLHSFLFFCLFIFLFFNFLIHFFYLSLILRINFFLIFLFDKMSFYFSRIFGVMLIAEKQFFQVFGNF